MTPEELFAAALAKVESASIRAWATTPKNQPIWLDVAKTAVAKGKPDVDLFTALIVSVAIGL